MAFYLARKVVTGFRVRSGGAWLIVAVWRFL